MIDWQFLHQWLNVTSKLFFEWSCMRYQKQTFVVNPFRCGGKIKTKLLQDKVSICHPFTIFQIGLH